MIDIDEECNELIQLLKAHKMYVHDTSAVKEGITIKLGNDIHIGVNKDAPMMHKFWILQHELSHILLDNLYDTNTPDNEIKEIEEITNTYMVYRCKIMPYFYKLYRAGATKDEIMEVLHLEPSIYDTAEKILMMTICKEVAK